MLRLSVLLHVLFHAIDKALGLIPPASILPLRIMQENVHRAIAINEYSVDVKSILKEVRQKLYAPISIKVVRKIREKVEYKRERLIGKD